MTFIGCDVIDLGEKQNVKSFANPKYLQKISTKNEWEKVHEPLIKPAFIWANKEASYKALCKFLPALPIFNTCDFIVDNILQTGDIFESQIKHQPTGYSLFAKTHIGDHYYFCIARLQQANHEKTCFFVEELNTRKPENASKQVRELLFRKLHCQNGFPLTSFKIDEQSRPYPILVHPLEKFIDISFSHDGEYIACAFDS